MFNAVSASPLIAHLREGETLLWTGKSNPTCYQIERKNKAKPLFIGGTLLMCICGLSSLYANGLCTFTIWTFLLGGLPPLCFLVLSQARVVVAPRWWYAVTDQRVFSNYPTDDAEEIWQLSLRDISSIKLKKHEDGRGTLLFSSFFHSYVPFECVVDAETVRDLINNAKSRLRLSSSSK